MMATRRAPIPASQERIVRVFVSSTFRDMQAEREELVKRVFPQLRKLCESRGVTWGEVDLRWGVTDEQKSEGRVLPICLAEINNCRPYFLGILGERYGWIPDNIPPILIEREPWLAGLAAGRSVTELEILHGVLQNPAMAQHAFFYFRDPAYLTSLQAERLAECRETALPEEVTRFGPQDAERRAEERRQKLAALKERIRGSGLPVREDYPDPKGLGELVLADLTSVINEGFPESEQPEPLDRQAAEHEVFAAGRARVYVSRPAYFEKLDEHAAGSGPPLAVLGESGAGKSALLANWVLHYRNAHPEQLVLWHFIGASAESSDWSAMLRRILGEFKRVFDIGKPIPERIEELRTTFGAWLHRAAARGRVVLVLDALNQLEDREGALDLAWLPPTVPARVRLIVSTLPGRALESIDRRGWPRLEIGLLTVEERRRLIVESLAAYAKALSAQKVERIAAAPQTANPLYLRTVIEDLRLWGDHFTLDDRVGELLAAPTIDTLYERILDRYEKDYERERPGLVRDALAMLWAARRGLSQAELLDLLGSNGEPLPGAYWSPLYLTAESALVNRSGLIGFFHEYLRKAVANRYLRTEQERRNAHLKLADYFERRETGPRRTEELPWQLMQAHDWPRLQAQLGDLNFLAAARKINPYDVLSYWARIEENSPLRIVDSYRPVLNDPAMHGTKVRDVAELLEETYHSEESLLVWNHLVGEARRSGNRVELQSILRRQANLLAFQGKLELAEARIHEAADISRALGDHESLADCLGFQAALSKDDRRSLKLQQEVERLLRQHGDRAGLSTSLQRQASRLAAQGNFDKAMPLYQEAETILRDLGIADDLASCLDSQGAILAKKCLFNEAMVLHRQAEQTARELGAKQMVSASLNNQALILFARGELDGALAMFRDVEKTMREGQYPFGAAIALENQAMVLDRLGRLPEAADCNGQGSRIWKELGYPKRCISLLSNQAILLRRSRRLADSLDAERQVERISREHGIREGIASSYVGQAAVLRDIGDLDGALARAKDAERLWRELGNLREVRRCIMDQSTVLQGKGDFAGAQAADRRFRRTRVLWPRAFYRFFRTLRGGKAAAKG